MTRKVVCALLAAILMVASVPFLVAASTAVPAFSNFATTETSVNAGETVTFTISTLAAVTHVFAEIDGERISAVRQTQPAPPAGIRNWTLSFIPGETQEVTVYANTSNATQGAATITLPITVTGTLPGVVVMNSVRRNAGPFSRGDAVIFTIETSEAVNYVFTQVDGRWVRATLVPTNINTGVKTWRLTVRPQETQVLVIHANSTFNLGGTAVTSRQTVEIRQPVPLQEAAPFFDTGGEFHGNTALSAWIDVVDRVTMGGERYNNALRFGSQSMTHGAFNSQPHSIFTLHNLGGRYNTLSGYIGRIDGTGQTNVTIRFYGDGDLIQSHNLTATAMPIPISVNVTGVTQLRIQVNFPSMGWTGTQYALIAYLE